MLMNSSQRAATYTLEGKSQNKPWLTNNSNNSNRLEPFSGKVREHLLCYAMHPQIARVRSHGFLIAAGKEVDQGRNMEGAKRQ
jgi:hypothetical protein